MKVGDKVLCNSWFPFIRCFEEGEYYVIDSINGNSISIVDNFGESFFLCFDKNKLHPEIEMKKFGDYFITKKELRKQKLLEITIVRNIDK